MNDASLRALIVRTLSGVEREKIADNVRETFGRAVPDATIDAAITAVAPENYGPQADALIANLRAAGVLK